MERYRRPSGLPARCFSSASADSEMTRSRLFRSLAVDLIHERSSALGMKGRRSEFELGRDEPGLDAFVPAGPPHTTDKRGDHKREHSKSQHSSCLVCAASRAVVNFICGERSDFYPKEV